MFFALKLFKIIPHVYHICVYLASSTRVNKRRCNSPRNRIRCRDFVVFFSVIHRNRLDYSFMRDSATAITISVYHIIVKRQENSDVTSPSRFLFGVMFHWDRDSSIKFSHFLFFFRFYMQFECLSGVTDGHRTKFCDH